MSNRCQNKRENKNLDWISLRPKHSIQKWTKINISLCKPSVKCHILHWTPLYIHSLLHCIRAEHRYIFPQNNLTLWFLSILHYNLLKLNYILFFVVTIRLLWYKIQSNKITGAMLIFLIRIIFKVIVYINIKCYKFAKTIQNILIKYIFNLMCPNAKNNNKWINSQVIIKALTLSINIYCLI